MISIDCRIYKIKDIIIGSGTARLAGPPALSENLLSRVKRSMIDAGSEATGRAVGYRRA